MWILLLALLMATAAHSADEVVGKRPYEMVWAGRTQDDNPPLVDFENMDGWTVTTEADGSVSYLRSFQTPGGLAVIRMVPGLVSLVSATPSTGYTVTTTQDGDVRLVIQFTASQTSDIVDAIWWNDAPYAQVSHIG